MKPNPWLTDVRSRLGFALLGTVAVTTLYAEGVLDIPWINLFTMTSGLDEGLVARHRFLLLLMAPVFGYLVAPRIRWLRDLLIIVTMCCFMASGLDVLFRLQKPTNTYDLHGRWLPRLPEVWRFDPNLDIRGESYGSLAVGIRGQELREPRVVVFQTDAAGFRNSHDGEGIDLLILGDSFGAGFATTQERIFASLLETQYGRRVYNLSLPGSPYHEYLNFLLESPNMTFSPNAQLVWLFFTGNDLFDSYGQIWDPASLPWREGMRAWVTTYRNFRGRSPLRHLIIASYRRLVADAGGEIVIQRELPNGQPILFKASYEEQVSFSKAAAEQHPHFSLLVRTMVEMRYRAAERGLDLTMVLIPAKEEVYRWILSQRERRPTDADPSGVALAVLDACRRAQIRCLDTKPDLIKKAYRLFDSSGELVYWRDDSHFNERGHEVVAEFIAREILSNSSHRSHLSSSAVASAQARPPK